MTRQDEMWLKHQEEMREIRLKHNEMMLKHNEKFYGMIIEYLKTIQS